MGRHRGPFPGRRSEIKGGIGPDMLATAIAALREAGYRVVNVDCTVIAQEPRLQAHLPKMKAQLANRIGTENVNIKGKSPEGLGALGQKAGIAAQAVATIEELEDPTARSR